MKESDTNTPNLTNSITIYYIYIQFAWSENYVRHALIWIHACYLWWALVIVITFDTKDKPKKKMEVGIWLNSNS